MKRYVRCKCIYENIHGIHYKLVEVKKDET